MCISTGKIRVPDAYGFIPKADRPDRSGLYFCLRQKCPAGVEAATSWFEVAGDRIVEKLMIFSKWLSLQSKNTLQGLALHRHFRRSEAVF
jgi:hypothetical protein